MRRYQLKYHVVGGFSFYERAEIKDMIRYLKFVQNPDDSIALLRVINTPARGIGKIDDGNAGAPRAGDRHVAVGCHRRSDSIANFSRSAPGRAEEFQGPIEDARAMLLGTFREQLEEAAEADR